MRGDLPPKHERYLRLARPNWFNHSRPLPPRVADLMPTDPKLPSKSLDLVLMVDVYHEFSEPVTMMRHIQEALKPDGRVVLVEFRKEDPSVPIQPLHKMSVQEVRSELEPLGFKFQRSLEFLPWQHIIIFSR